MKMKTAITFLLMLGLSRCTVKDNFESEMVTMGNNVTLTCPRKISWLDTQLFWIRLVSGNLPEILGGTYSFEYEDVKKTSHFTTKQEPGAFVLIIDKTEPSDTGLYFCVKQELLNMTLLKGTFLKVKGPQPDVTAIVQDISPDPVHPGDIMTLQCSVLFDPEKKTCSGNHSVFWWRSGSDESYLRVIYTHGNRRDECEESLEAQSPQKCVYSFSKTVSSSDSGTYYCAVDTCDQMLFGHGTTIDVKEDNLHGMQTLLTALSLVSAALVISLMFLVYLVYRLNRTSCVSCSAADVQKTNSERAAQQSLQEAEASLFYSAPTFSKKKTGKRERRHVKAAEEEIVYSSVRTAETD